ncbi:carboxylesterase/lipase family protein [Pseudomonas putida]
MPVTSSRRRFLQHCLSVSAVALLPPFALAATDAPTQIKVAQGVLLGQRQPDGTRTWKGVPFAHPPVGELRFKAPQPLQAWHAPLKAEAYGPWAVQQPYPPVAQDKPKGEEDCLYLNIWAPAEAASRPRPVMVWIHGGAFVLGSGGDPRFDGSDYAQRGDLLFVTVNYRMGGFGYLQVHDEPGAANLGLQDQIAALRWVRDNIAAFGGDPTNVTVMGESAGAMSIGCLLGAPAAKDLFKRAIIQSGGARPLFQANETAQVLHQVLQAGAVTTAQLQYMPVADLNNLFIKVASQSNTPLLGGEAYHPAVDGSLLPHHPLEGLTPVPTLIGHCRDESGLFVAGKAVNLLEGLPARVRAKVGEAAWQQVVQTYQATTAAGGDWQRELFSDIFVGVPALRLADRLSAAGAPVWTYRFDYAQAGPYGPCHGSDIPYTFGLGQPGKGRGSFTAAEQALSQQMRDCFIAFAHTGDPQTKALPAWPRHDAQALDYLRFDTPLSLGRDYLGAERRAVWQAVPIAAL